MPRDRGRGMATLPVLGPFGIEHPVALFGALSFALFGFYFAYRGYRSEGFEDFSVGVSYTESYSIIITLVPAGAAAAYTLMAFGLGFTAVGPRTVSYLRYFEWGMTTPILMAGVVLIAQDRRFLGRVMFADLAMIASGFFATVLPAPLRYVPLALGGAALGYILYALRVEGPDLMDHKPDTTKRLFRRFSILVLALWPVYPLAWMLSTDGFALIGLEASLALFLALDLAAKIGYGFVVLREIEALS